MKQKLVWILIALLALSLLATSFVSARNYVAQDVMTSHLVTIPGGSTHPDYDGALVGSDQTISLTSGWTHNLPNNTCAIAARLGFKDNTYTHYATLQPAQGQGYPILATVQVPWVWINDTGIVPITTSPPEMYLWLSSSGYVDIEITGYWVCDEYMPPPRPTPAP